MHQKFYTIEEVASLLHVHRTYVASLIEEKKLSALKIGRSYRIRHIDLEKLFGGKIEKLFTINNLAKILKINRVYISRLIKEGEIKALHIGKFYRIKESDFQSFIEGKRVNLYTIEDVGAILKIHRTYVASIIRHNILSALKIGRFYRIREDELEKLIQGKLVPLLSLDDIAETLKVHRTYIGRLVREGKIKSLKIGKFYRIREDDFNTFLKESEI